MTETGGKGAKQKMAFSAAQRNSSDAEKPYRRVELFILINIMRLTLWELYYLHKGCLFEFDFSETFRIA